MLRQTIWKDMHSMQEDMDKLFTSFFGRGTYPQLAVTQKKKSGCAKYREAVADVSETEKEAIVRVELPGVDKKDIAIDVQEGGLSIKVERKHEHEIEDKEKGYCVSKRSCQGFYRFIRLPEEIDEDTIKASYSNGVLEIRIPKKSIETQEKVKRIEVA